MLVNLVVNALEAASRPSGSLPRQVLVRVAIEAERVMLGVGDSGAGPAEETRPRMFEPFVSEKPEGTGLGLFVVREIAAAHGGAVGYRRQDGQSWFEAEFPLPARTRPDGAPVDCG